MFAQYRVVKLSETDASGLVYFTEVQKYAMEAFEEYLDSKGFGIAEILNHEEFLAPVVNVSVDYLCPMFVGDLVSIQMSLEKIGVSSFTLKYEIVKDEADFTAAFVRITQVFVDKNTRHAAPISSEFLEFLKSI